MPVVFPLTIRLHMLKNRNDFTALALFLAWATASVSCSADEALQKAQADWLQTAQELYHQNRYKEWRSLVQSNCQQYEQQIENAIGRGDLSAARKISAQLKSDLHSIHASRDAEAQNLADLAYVEAAQGNTNVSNDLINQALAQLEQYSKLDRAWSHVLMRKAMVESKSGRNEDALSDMRRALFIAEGQQQRRFHDLGWKFHTPLNTFADKVFDPDVACVLKNYAAVLDKAGKISEAKVTARRAKIFAVAPAYSADAAEKFAAMFKPVLNFSRNLESEDGGKDLEALLQKGQSFGSNSGPYYMSLLGAALFYSGKRQYQQEAHWYEKAFDLATEVFGPEHPLTIMTKEHYALALVNQPEMRTKAESLIKQNVDFWRRTAPFEWTYEWNTLQGLLNIYALQKNVAGEIEVRKRLVALTEEGAKQAPTRLYDPLTKLAECYIRHENYKEAEPVLQRIVDIHLKNDRDFGGLEPMDQLGQVKTMLGKPSEAVDVYKTAIAIAEKSPHSYHLPTLLDHAAVALRKCNRVAEAESLEASARQLRVKDYPSPF